MVAAVTGRAQDGNLDGTSIARLREVFEGSFEARNWPKMVKILNQMIQLGEEEGVKDLCLRAQALRNLVLGLKPELNSKLSFEKSDLRNMNSNADAEFLMIVAPVFEQTRFYLSHFHWSNPISH